MRWVGHVTRIGTNIKMPKDYSQNPRREDRTLEELDIEGGKYRTGP
jgi:hypothetical protein